MRKAGEVEARRRAGGDISTREEDKGSAREEVLGRIRERRGRATRGGGGSRRTPKGTACAREKEGQGQGQGRLDGVGEWMRM